MNGFLPCDGPNCEEQCSPIIGDGTSLRLTVIASTVPAHPAGSYVLFCCEACQRSWLEAHNLVADGRQAVDPYEEEEEQKVVSLH